MTDRQITESTIGLAGRLSHLPYGLAKAEDCGWKSTRNFVQRTPVFKELGFHKTWRPTTGSTSLQFPGSSATNWHTSKKQQKWLLKANPEARLGNECIHDELVSSHSSSQTYDNGPWSSSLFAIGELTDTSEPHSVSGAPLVAIVTGEANDVLRLAKPGVEEWQWHGEDNVSLGFGDLTEQDESIIYREEFAGPIRRLKSVVDSKRYDPTRWIVVQRDSGTRVFQPEYRLAPTISAYDHGGKTSRIAANPLFFLSKDQTGGSLHLDASFNPGIRSKPPQLGLIDECGFWSIWDISHTKIRSSRKPKVRLSKCGHIEQGILNCLPSKGTGEPQWHKMLWVGCPLEDSQDFGMEEDAENSETQSSFPQLERSSTLLLCNTKLVRLLDLTNNSALSDLPFIAERSRDCVLDVQQNPRDTQYIFVLTTSKLFVVRAYSALGQDWGKVQKYWNIVLAVSHLRDSFDRSLKLTVAPGAALPERNASLVYISSNSNARIDLFCVTMMKSNPSMVAYHSEPVVLDVFRHTSTEMAPLMICVHPIPVASKPSKITTEFGRSFAVQQVQFYQLAILKKDMCLVSSLGVSSFSLSIDQINRPDYKVTRTRDLSKERKKALKEISARFVVPDDVATYGDEGEYHPTITPCISRWTVTRRPVGVFYEFLRAMFNEVKEHQESPVRDEEFGYNLFDDVHIAIERLIEDGNMPATTIFQMMEDLKLPNDISLAASEWRLEIERLGHINADVMLLALDQPRIQIFKSSNSLNDLYSALVLMIAGVNFDDGRDGWIQEVRSTALRQIACDVYLSLIGLVHRHVDHQVDLKESQRALAYDLDKMVIDSQQGSRAGSVARSQSEFSTTSSKESETENSPEEDPAMTLLRSYTGTGKFVPTRNTALLDKWEVGGNLDDYMFDLHRDDEVTPGMQRRAKKLARESRKRRRAETLLQVHKDQEPSLPATQPAPSIHFSGQHSQPVGGFSSQPIKSDLLHTMSQPMAGMFGRRDERPKKKVKKRQGGF